MALVFLMSLLFSSLIIPRLSHIADKIGLMDQPGERKIHRRPEPLVGGLGMIMALSLTSLLFFTPYPHEGILFGPNYTDHNWLPR